MILPADHDETNHLDSDAGVGEEGLHLGGDIGNVPGHGRHPDTDTDSPLTFIRNLSLHLKIFS